MVKIYTNSDKEIMLPDDVIHNIRIQEIHETIEYEDGETYLIRVAEEATFSLSLIPSLYLDVEQAGKVYRESACDILSEKNITMIEFSDDEGVLDSVHMPWADEREQNALQTYTETSYGIEIYIGANIEEFIETARSMKEHEGKVIQFSKRV